MDFFSFLTLRVIFYIIGAISILMIIFDYINEVNDYNDSWFKIFRNEPLSGYSVFFSIIIIIILDIIINEFL